MRARNIKPGFYRDADLAECSPQARLMAPGLWMLADREGRLKDNPRQIKMELFPCDNWDIEELLNELVKAKHIFKYEVDGVAVIQVRNFTEHQNPHKNEPESQLPEFSGRLDTLREHSSNYPSARSTQEAKNKGGSNDEAKGGDVAEMPHCNKNDAPAKSVYPCGFDTFPEHSSNYASTRADSLNPDILIPDPGNNHSSFAMMGGRLKKPKQGRKATTEQWVNALGNGLKTWFEVEFWPLQLRKVGKKECAMSVYDLNPSEELRARMVAAYQAQCERDFCKRELSKIPHPATWVNGGRWEDEVTDGCPMNEFDRMIEEARRGTQ